MLLARTQVYACYCCLLACTLCTRRRRPMRKLSPEKRAMVLSALVEGSSVGATSRMVGCSKVTILRLLSDVGSFCADYHDLTVRRLCTERVECDELWSYCGCKERQRLRGAQGHGDVWTWVGL